MSPKNGAKKMKGNASETVTEAKNAMNKKAPPGDVNNSNMCNDTVKNDTAFEIQLDDDTTFEIQQNEDQSSKTEQMASESISTNHAIEDQTYALPVGSHGQKCPQSEQELDPHCPLCLEN